MRGIGGKLGSDEPATYRIKVRGRLGEGWSDWFSGMATEVEADTTTLVGTVPDQGALHGILSRIRDLNLTVVSVTQVEPEEPASHQRQGGG